MTERYDGRHQLNPQMSSTHSNYNDRIIQNDVIYEESYSYIPVSYADESEYIFDPSTSYEIVVEDDLNEEIGEPFKQEVEEEIEVEYVDVLEEEAPEDQCLKTHREDVKEEIEYDEKPNVVKEELGPLPEEEINSKTGKPFKCRICGKPFNVRTNVKRHYSMHSNEKPFECSICFTKFKALANLKRHENLHLEDRAVNYNHIKDSWREQVEQHRVVVNRPRRNRRHPLCHRPAESFSCRMCESVFPNFGHLLKHYSQVHQLDGMTTWKMMYGNSKKE